MSGAPPAVAIEAGRLSKRFGAKTAVDKLGLTVRQGEIFGLVGPDGAGKTTAMRMLASVMLPDEGTVTIDGVDALAQPERAKRHLSYMPQRFGLYEDLTVDENIRFYADVFEVPSDAWRARADALLAMSGMAQFRQRLAGKLSGGMKQKLGLACSLVHTPRVLLLDEPTTGVDPVSRREFWQILYSLRAEGVAILIATAYLDEAERCDRLAFMNEGIMLECDSPDALKAHMPGAILDVISTDPHAVRDAVASLPGVRDVLIVGTGAHVHVDDAKQALPRIMEKLGASGIAASGVSETPPSMEDVFLAFVRGRGKPAP